MKNCPNCNIELNDEAVFCTNCGFSLAAQNSQDTPQAQDWQSFSPQQPSPQMDAQLQLDNDIAQPVYAPQVPPQSPYPTDPTAFQQQNVAFPQASYAMPAQLPTQMSKEEFYKLPALEKPVKQVRYSAIICYVCAGITALMAMAVSPSALIDAAILLALGLVIHFRKSFIAAVVLASYAVINTIYLVATTGTLGGWLIIIAGVTALYATWGLRKAWKQYEQTGSLPTANTTQ